MYISNPNRRNRANTPQPDTTPRRTPDPNAYNNSPQTPTPPFQTPQNQGFDLRTPQPQMNAPMPQTPPYQAPMPQTPPYQAPQPQAPQYQGGGMGGIVVRVTTASGAIPLEDALVTISEYGTGSGGDIVATLRTDSSGLTEKISLPTPPKSLSLSPGNGKSYSSYVIEVKRDGYNTQQYINVPVFDGVIAVQNADLVPLPENGETDRADPYNPGIFYESEAPRLDRTNQNN